MCVCVCALVCRTGTYMHIYLNPCIKFVNYTFRSLTHFFLDLLKSCQYFKIFMFIFCRCVGALMHRSTQRSKDSLKDLFLSYMCSLPCRFWGFNSGCQAQQQEPLPVEPVVRYLGEMSFFTYLFVGILRQDLEFVIILPHPLKFLLNA